MRTSDIALAPPTGEKSLCRRGIELFSTELRQMVVLIRNFLIHLIDTEPKITARHVKILIT